MVTHNDQSTPSDEDIGRLRRRLARLGPLMRHKARVEADPPDEAFVRDLEQRLIVQAESERPTNPAQADGP